MQDNKELFDLLKVKSGGVRAKNINNIDRAVAAHINSCAGPDKEVLANIMLAASKKKRFAIKNMFTAFNYRIVLAGAMVLMLAIAVPTALKHKEVADTEIYSSTMESRFELLDADLDYIMTGLSNIDNMSFMEESV